MIESNEVSNKDLRIFALIFSIGVIFLEWYFSGKWFGTLGLSALAFLLIGLCLPILLKYPYKAWLSIGLIMGFVMIRVMLSLSYFLIITPTALFFKITGRDILKLKKEKCETYWDDYDKHPSTIERYRKLF